MVYAVTLQRVQEPTNLRIRRLNAIIRKAIHDPKPNIFPRMNLSGDVDIHSDSGDRKLTGEEDDDTERYGVICATLLRRGHATGGKPVVHL